VQRKQHIQGNSDTRVVVNNQNGGHEIYIKKGLNTETCHLPIYKLTVQFVRRVKYALTSNHALERRGFHPPYEFSNINSK
jgi:hypothetical protein